MAAIRALILAGMMLIIPASSFSAEGGGRGYISPDRVYSLMKEGSGMWLVDVRGPAAYEECHIEGSINIPFEQLRLKRISKERLIVLVDDSIGNMKAEEAAKALAANGIEKILVLEGGLYEWANSGRALAGNAARAYTPTSITPEEFKQAFVRGVRMKVYDLRGTVDAGVPGSEKVEGKDVDERTGRLLTVLSKTKDKGIASKLKKAVPIVLLLPVSNDSLRAASMVSRTGYGEVRYLVGNYEVTTEGVAKTISMNTGGCPTCPKSIK